MIRCFFILVLFTCVIKADESSFAEKIDLLHEDISRYIKNVGTFADQTLFSLLSDQNESEEIIQEYSSSKTYHLEKRVDHLFLEKKYLESTNRSYIRLNLGESMTSSGESKLTYAYSAKVDLHTTKKRLQLFVDDLRRDEQIDALATQSAILSERTDQATVGLSYFYPQKYGINMKSAIAVHGLNPFARLRFEYPLYMGRWSFFASEKMIYSIKHKFEEQSDFYLDNRLNDSSLVRLYASRSTTQESEGIGYSSGVQYFYTPHSDRGLSLSLYATGNTKYMDCEAQLTNITTCATKNQFYSYTFAPSWRQNIYKNWLFFQITPSVSWHEQRDYDPSYNLAFSFDMYFGNRP